ncbi:MAG TPA: GNAT family N-acetyltransferase [Acidimicrobiales bacterium]
MSAAPADVISWGRESARTGRWRGDEQVAYLTPLPTSPLPSAEFVRQCLDTLAGRGFKRVVTAALSPLEQVGFLAAGFDVEERLYLLGMDISRGLPEVPPGLPLRRVPPWRRADVLAVDAMAFPPFWQLDSAGLKDSLRATPVSRFRMAAGGGRGVAGYAVCGRSGDRGFVQRLAVDPRRQRVGTGRRLLLDGLHWLARGGATRAIVNTQIGNDAALSLYLATGFREEPVGLSVLSAGLQ